MEVRMTTTQRARAGWRTRDIVVTAVIAVAFGVFFWAFGLAWSALAWMGPIGPQNLLYAGWLLPAIVAPLIVRKPGAALFAELVAASLSALLGSQWSLDTILSGAMQGGAAELVFLAARYRNWSLPVVAAASLAATAAAFLHDWLIYYPTFDATAQHCYGWSRERRRCLFCPARVGDEYDFCRQFRCQRRRRVF
jgi:energy-coupling factor transport system substrate-specific component